jgi:hypothetical protein
VGLSSSVMSGPVVFLVMVWINTHLAKEMPSKDYSPEGKPFCIFLCYYNNTGESDKAGQLYIFKNCLLVFKTTIIIFTSIID